MCGHGLAVPKEYESPGQVGVGSVNLAVHQIAKPDETSDKGYGDNHFVEYPACGFLAHAP